ncbi:MAG: serine/threonine-protein kinase, partial [Oscillospiraceae bacterium]|nr:serine/threonine-protein kinase [Oscillospiraceae bacterium]
MEMCPDCFCRNITDGICGDCGFNTAEYVWEDYQLPMFTVIGGKYIIGRAIGEGGFGITYTAYNKELNAKYAVKEYYPAEISGRGYSSPDGMTIYPFSGYDDEFAKGLERFEREAKQLAQFDGMEGIVNVKDYITENGTGYIFMEFVSGKSLETYLTEHNGKISFHEAKEILKPVISALSQLHKNGLIHRDISPDNIIISEENGPILIDFGASRNYSDEKSMSVIVKYGYAPFEQYSRHGGQGPWTDVYAVCAVLYRMITGKKPPDSVARIQDSAELTPLSELCDNVPPACEAVIMKGLAVNKEDRLQSMDELYNVLYENGKAGSRKKPIIAEALVAAVIVAAAFSAYKLSDRNAEEAIALHTTDQSAPQYTEAPQTSQRIEIVTAAPSYEPYSPTVMYGLPTHEDEAYIRGRMVIDLANTEKAAADDPSALLKIKPSDGSPIAPIELNYLEEEDTSISQSFGVLIIPPAINSF